MHLKVMPIALSGKITSLFMLLVFISPVIRLVVGFVPYLAVLSIIASFVFVQFFKNTYKGYAVFWLIFVLIMMSVFVTLSAHGNLEALFFSAASLINLLVAYWLAKQNKEKVSTVSFYALVSFYLVFFCSGINYGFGPNDVNNYFIESSRNIVSAMGLFLQILYSTAHYRAKKVLPKVTPIITFIISFVAYGRSGIALSAIFLFITYASIFRQSKFVYKLAFIVVVLVLVLMVSQYAVIMKNIFLTESNFSSGLDTPRVLMIQSYLESLDFVRVLVGVDLSSVPIINQYNNNPHSSVIYGHSQYGVLYILFMLSLVAIVAKSNPFKRGVALYVSFLSIFFIRVLVDKMSLPGIFDYLPFYIFCIILFDSKKCKREETKCLYG